MNDFEKALGFSREAEAARQAAYKSGDKAEIAAAHARCSNTQYNLMIAIDILMGEQKEAMRDAARLYGIIDRYIK